MYDDNSNRTELLIYYETGELGIKTVYANFKNHRPTSGNSYDGQGKLFSNKKFTYDKQGNEIENTEFDPSGNKETTIKQEYYEDMPISYSHISYENSSYNFSFKWEYNKNKDIVKQVMIDDEGEKQTTYQYTYDQHKNWIKRIETGPKTAITERKIEYW
jgi:hypothetical protein